MFNHRQAHIVVHRHRRQHMHNTVCIQSDQRMAKRAYGTRVITRTRKMKSTKASALKIEIDILKSFQFFFSFILSSDFNSFSYNRNRIHISFVCLHSEVFGSTNSSRICWFQYVVFDLI